MRDNSDGMVELLRTYDRDGRTFGLVRVTIGADTRPVEIPLSSTASAGFSRVVGLQPFDTMAGVQHRFFFARSVRRLEGEALAEVGIRVEVGPDAKTFDVKVPLEFASNLIWLAQVRDWNQLARLGVGGAG